jgi:uncharacterized PurR-regulated membrane protein YhhQ (DUF165 family)
MRLIPSPALVAAYLAAIVLANLSVVAFGPPAAIVNAFVLIALDLVARDRLHEAWAGRALWPRMGMLILSGGLISYALGAGPVAAASCAAFVLAGLADAAAYHAARRLPWLARANLSNVAGATVDSAVFVLLAFGPAAWPFIPAQLAAKVAGGAVWSWLLRPHAIAEEAAL